MYLIEAIWSGVKCINKHLLVYSTFILSILFLSGCNSLSYDIPYDVNTSISAYSISERGSSSENLKSFAADLCVASNDINVEKADLSLADSGILFNKSTKETLYSKNPQS